VGIGPVTRASYSLPASVKAHRMARRGVFIPNPPLAHNVSMTTKLMADNVCICELPDDANARRLLMILWTMIPATGGRRLADLRLASGQSPE